MMKHSQPQRHNTSLLSLSRLLRRLVMLAPLWLLGCSSTTPQIHWYRLVQADAQLTTAVKNQHQHQRMIMLSRLQLKPYLTQGSLVMQLSDSELQFSEQHRWATDLTEDIQQLLVKQLTQLGDQITVASNVQPLKPNDTTVALNIVIDQFLITQHHSVLLSGDFELISPQWRHQQPFSIELSLKANGYPHAVEQLSNTLPILAQQIHQGLIKY